MRIKVFILSLLFSLTFFLNIFGEIPEWVRSARIVGAEISFDMDNQELRSKIDDYAKQGVSALLIWTKSSDDHNFTKEDRAFLKEVSSYIHRNHKGMKVIVYIAPLEEQSYDVDMNEDGKVDPGKKSIYTEHPEWLQVGIDGRPAVFYGNIAFWIEPNSEDVWICPNDPEIRKIWYKKVVEIAKTGVDGVWWDVPFFINSFGDNWDENWTCYCDDCQNSFKKFSGSGIPSQVNWNNPLWRRFIDWRFFSTANFIKECKRRAKTINPNFVIINESWDPNDVFLTQVGFSPYYMRISKSDDGIAHEFGSQDPQNYHYYSYLLDTAQGIIYRGVDKERASWILSYSNNKEHSKTRCASVLFSGSNFFEVGYPYMAGTVDLNLRTKLFNWIKENEEFYYNEEITPYTEVALFYSFPSLKYYGLVSYENPYELLGTAMLLLENKIPFEVITDDKIEDLQKYRIIFLPSVFSLSDIEIKAIKEFVKNGGTVVMSGRAGLFNEKGERREKFPFNEICGSLSENSSEIKINNYGEGYCIFTLFKYGLTFYNASAPTIAENEIDFEKKQKTEQFFKKIVSSLNFEKSVSVLNGEQVLVSSFRSDKLLILRINNLKGLKQGIFTPIPQNNISLKIRLPKGFSPTSAKQIELLEEAKPLNFKMSKGVLTVNFAIKRHKLLIFNLSNKKRINPLR